MRRLSMYALLVVAMLPAACKQAELTTTAPAPGEVKVKVNCLPNDGFSFSLSPWRVTLPSPTGSFTFKNDNLSDVDVEITSQNTKYPFGNQSLRAAHGKDAVGKPVAGTPPGTYKYIITAACPGGGPKAVIDPDMIIPN